MKVARPHRLGGDVPTIPIRVNVVLRVRARTEVWGNSRVESGTSSMGSPFGTSEDGRRRGPERQGVALTIAGDGERFVSPSVEREESGSARAKTNGPARPADAGDRLGCEFEAL